MARYARPNWQGDEWGSEQRETIQGARETQSAAIARGRPSVLLPDRVLPGQGALICACNFSSSCPRFQICDGCHRCQRPLRDLWHRAAISVARWRRSFAAPLTPCRSGEVSDGNTRGSTSSLKGAEPPGGGMRSRPSLSKTFQAVPFRTRRVQNAREILACSEGLE